MVKQGLLPHAGSIPATLFDSKIKLKKSQEVHLLLEFLIIIGVVIYIAYESFVNSVINQIRRDKGIANGQKLYTDTNGTMRMTSNNKPVHSGLYNGMAVYLYQDGTLAYDSQANKELNREREAKAKAIANGDKYYPASIFSPNGMYYRRVSDDKLFIREKHYHRGKYNGLDNVIYPAKAVYSGDRVVYTVDR